MNTCAVCSGPDAPQNPLIPEEFYPTEFIHLHCLNSAEGRRWRDERKARDAGFKRYMDLITVGRKVPCPACSSDDNSLSQKSSGHSPMFELCCTSCDRYSHGLSPYTHAVTGPLSDLRQDFVLGVNLERIEPEVERLSREQAAKVPPEKCPCGGSFVIAAKPRCHQCKAVLADTYFHFNDQSPRKHKG